MIKKSFVICITFAILWWLFLVKDVLCEDNLKLPTVKELLLEAGYTEKDNIEIYKSSISIVNLLNAPDYDVYLYMFADRDGDGRVLKKAKVIVYNHLDKKGINLLMFAPAVVFEKVFLSEDGIPNDQVKVFFYSEELSNIPKGRGNAEKFLTNPPFMGGSRIASAIFKYNEDDKIKNTPKKPYWTEEGNILGKIFKLALEGLNDISGKGKAYVTVCNASSECNPIPLTYFTKIYPTKAGKINPLSTKKKN